MRLLSVKTGRVARLAGLKFASLQSVILLPSSYLTPECFMQWPSGLPGPAGGATGGLSPVTRMLFVGAAGRPDEAPQIIPILHYTSDS